MALRDDDTQQVLQLKSSLTRYGLPLMVLVITLASYLGWQWWKHRQSVQSAHLTMQYYNATQKVQQSPNEAAGLAQKIVSEQPQSAQALQSQLLLAKLAFDRKDYKTADQVLTRAVQSKVDDQGLLVIAKLHLAYTQIAQNRLEDALKTLNTITLTAFVPSVAEAKGDIYVLQNQPESAKVAYQQAWEALKQRQQPSELLRLKLADLGVVVEMPNQDSPIVQPDASVSSSEGSAPTPLAHGTRADSQANP